MPRFLATALSSRVVLCLLLGMASLAWARAANAQSARDLYLQGTQSLNAGQFAEAAQQLDASYRKEPSAVVLYNLGLAYKGMGHPSKALEAFESYVKFADATKDGKTIAAVRSEIDRMKNGYARYALKLTPAEATITIDGQPATLSDGELWVQTGSHKIAFHASGYEEYEQTLEASAGRFDLEVNLRQAGPPDQRAAALIEEGVALQAAGNVAQAADKYRQAEAIYPTPRGAGQAGLAEEQIGDTPEAEGHIDSALKSPKDKWVRKNKAKLMAASKRVKRLLATIDVQGEPAGAVITVNDKPRGVLPLGKIRVVGGSLVVRAKKDGYIDAEESFDLPAHAERTIVFSMQVQPAPVIVPVPEPVAAVPALAPKPEPVEQPPVVAQPDKTSQTDVEAQSELMPQPLPDTHDTATGFEMALNFGYSALIGGPKTDGSRGMLSPQLLFGARILWPLSFGIQLNGGWDSSVRTASVVAAANPGLYVRGHIQHYKKALGFDAWAGAGFQPVAMQFALLKAQTIDPSMVDINSLDESAKADLARNMAGVDHVHTIQSINVPFELGGAFYITEGFGIDLTTALTLWMPQQSCLHDGTDRLCFDSKLKSQTTFFIGGGLVFLP
jgi:tetratricopeptide (TPR) repeat protein